jgi:hypothetical protein
MKPARLRSMSSEEITLQGQQETTANGRNKTTNNKKPTWWKRFKEWTKKDKTFTDWCIAAFTFVLAVTAIYQFGVMGGQLDTMRKDQRPWVGLTFTIALNNNALQVGEPIKAVAHVVNDGKTPARSVTGHIVIEMVKNGEEPRLNYDLRHSRFTTGALFPNQSEEYRAVASVPPVTQAESDDFDQRKSFVVVYGIVSYRDFFGKWHWTKMCNLFTTKPPNAIGGVTAILCADYGDIDGN